VRWLMLGSLVAAAVASFCVLRLARATLPLGPARVGWLWAAANVLLFGIAQAETWLHAAQVAAYRAGKQQLFGFFVGQLMKETGGKADARVANEVLKELLS